MLIQIDDLKIGDEILIGSQGDGNLRWLKILKLPTIGKKLHYRTKQPLYKATLCSGNVTIKEHVNTYNGRIHKYTTKVWKFTGEDHNTNIYVNLNDRLIWLIKRD